MTTVYSTKLSSKFSHSSLTVRDIDSMSKWYCKAFGFNKSMEGEIKGNKNFSKAIGIDNADLLWAQLKTKDLDFNLELIQFLNNKDEKKMGYSFNHLGFIVDDIEEKYQYLKNEMGMKFISPPLKINEFVKTCFGFDPENNRIELVEELK